MYVLVYKDRVIAGPRDWNRAMFNGALEDAGITGITLPRVAVEELPYVINDDARIMECRLEYPEHNPKTQYPHGPFWDFSQLVAVGTFQVVDIPIEVIKNTLKAEIANERYRQEIEGINVEVQGQTFRISTRREDRDVYAQTAGYLADGGTVNWKFDRTWLTLNKTELLAIAAAVSAHVQGVFNWEHGKNQEIEAATTSAELDAIVIREENPQG